MRHGFIKVAAVTPTVHLANPEGNADEIIRLSKYASDEGAKLIVFPELSVTGATLGDLFLHKQIISGAEAAICRIAAETTELPSVICVGAPVLRENKLYNCAVVIYGGMILGIAPKKTLCAKGIMDKRVFTPAPEKCGTVEFGGICVPFGHNMTFYCEGMHDFNFACEIGADLYGCTPASENHCRAGATVVAGLSAMPETVGMAERRRLFAASHSAHTSCGYILAEAGYGESTTDCVFGGHRLICEAGNTIAETKPFCGEDEDCPVTFSEIDVSKLAYERMRRGDFETIEVTADNYYSISFDMELCDTELTRKIQQLPFVPEDAQACRDRCEEILNIQAHGLKRRLCHTGAKSAVIGISGGLDSCLALLVSVRAMELLGRTNSDIIAVTMPCFGTTSRTRTNAERLCERLGVSFRCVDIKAAVNQHFSDIGHDAECRNVVYENVQARERTQVIMDIANAEGGIVIGTGDLSELALGWATFNGDHMSMYGVNSSVPKTLIRHIVAYAADTCGDGELKSVLLDILATPVSPELLPAEEGDKIAQKTEDIVGPYELHDFFLYYFVRFGMSPDKLYRMACHAFSGIYDGETVKRWLDTFLGRFVSQQFKRSCLPDGPSVGSVSLSPRGGFSMPSDALSAVFFE